jgi:hypothetical protein
VSIDNGGDEAAQQAAYDGAAEPAGHIEDISSGINAVVEFMVPYKVLSRVKRQMRRKIRKPLGMTIRVFFSNFIRVNDEEIPHLPPNFNVNQSLPDDEISEIMLHAVPSSWTKKLMEQHRNYDEMTPMQLLNEFEKYEATEETPKPKSDDKGKKSSKKGKGNDGQSVNRSDNNNNNNNNNNNKASGKGKKFCLYHKHNNTHTTEQCKVLQGMVDSNQDNRSSKNKTWNRGSSGDKANQELKAMVSESVKETMQDLHAMSKKRKATSDEDLNAFDYSEFDKLAVEEEAEA